MVQFGLIITVLEWAASYSSHLLVGSRPFSSLKTFCPSFACIPWHYPVSCASAVTYSISADSTEYCHEQVLWIVYLA